MDEVPEDRHRRMLALDINEGASSRATQRGDIQFGLGASERRASGHTSIHHRAARARASKTVDLTRERTNLRLVNRARSRAWSRGQKRSTRSTDTAAGQWPACLPR